MKKRSASSGGVYYVPPIWHGPAGDLPERYRREGVPLSKVGVDPARVQRFVTYTMPAKPSTSE